MILCDPPLILTPDAVEGVAYEKDGSVDGLDVAAAAFLCIRIEACRSQLSEGVCVRMDLDDGHLVVDDDGDDDNR
jgi:hypothetical protein